MREALLFQKVNSASICFVFNYFIIVQLRCRARHVTSSPSVPAKLLQELIGDSGYDSSISWVLQITLGVTGQVSLRGDKSAATSRARSKGVA